MNSGPQAPFIAGHLMGSIHMKVHIFLKGSALYGLLCKRRITINRATVAFQKSLSFSYIGFLREEKWCLLLWSAAYAISGRSVQSATFSVGHCSELPAAFPCSV